MGGGAAAGGNVSTCLYQALRFQLLARLLGSLMRPYGIWYQGVHRAVTGLELADSRACVQLFTVATQHL